jgi:hypothetical protein
MAARRIPFQLRLTQAESRELRRRAKAAGVAASVYVRMLVFGPIGGIVEAEEKRP